LPRLRQTTTTLSFETRGRGLLEITRPVLDWVTEVGLDSGLLTLFVRHTSASLLVQENADPDVRGDLDRFFARLVPDGDPVFLHRDEGADDMPAHVRAALTAVHLSVPIAEGRLVLGTWQGLYLWEHRVRDVVDPRLTSFLFNERLPRPRTFPAGTQHRVGSRQPSPLLRR
jgi:secondary thiamine-phosphate synthase enzyme